MLYLRIQEGLVDRIILVIVEILQIVEEFLDLKPWEVVMVKHHEIVPVINHSLESPL